MRAAGKLGAGMHSTRFWFTRLETPLPLASKAAAEDHFSGDAPLRSEFWRPTTGARFPRFSAVARFGRHRDVPRRPEDQRTIHRHDSYTIKKHTSWIVLTPNLESAVIPPDEIRSRQAPYSPQPGSIAMLRPTARVADHFPGSVIRGATAELGIKGPRMTFPSKRRHRELLPRSLCWLPDRK
jgi:hypothetical protein